MRTRTLCKPEAKAPERSCKPARGLFWGAVYFPAGLAQEEATLVGESWGFSAFGPTRPLALGSVMAQPFQVLSALPESLDQELCLVLSPSLEKLLQCQLASRRRGRLIPWQLQSCPGQGTGVGGVGMEVPPWGRATEGVAGCHLQRCFLFTGR